MSGIAERLKALPEGTILLHAFHALIAIAAFMVLMDLRETVNAGGDGSLAMPALSPVPMARPERDNQTRPSLPLTRPVAPDETSERLHNRPHEESEAEPMQFRLGTHGAAFAD